MKDIRYTIISSIVVLVLLQGCIGAGLYNARQSYLERREEAAEPKIVQVENLSAISGLKVVGVEPIRLRGLLTGQAIDLTEEVTRELNSQLAEHGTLFRKTVSIGLETTAKDRAPTSSTAVYDARLRILPRGVRFERNGMGISQAAVRRFTCEIYVPDAKLLVRDCASRVTINTGDVGAAIAQHERNLASHIVAVFRKAKGIPMAKTPRIALTTAFADRSE
jgi:hypothetical protein